MFDKKTFNNLCTPAKIYFGIAVIAAVIALSNSAPFSYVAMKMLFAFIWTYILGFLCSKGYGNISWFLVLLPYIVILLAMLRIAYITEHRGIFRSLGIQGAYGKEAMTTTTDSTTTTATSDDVTEEKCKASKNMQEKCTEKKWW